MKCFNPIVDDWNEEAKRREIMERETSDYVVYVITGWMKGYYSIAEVIDDSNKRPKKTVFCFLKDSFPQKTEDDIKRLKSMEAIYAMAARNGAYVCKTLDSVITYLNSR